WKEAVSVGMFMTGTGSIHNANGAEVSASAEDGEAVGIMALATGGQVSVLNDGTVGATGGNEAAGMYVAAHNIPGGRNGEVVLTNNGVIEAHSAGAAAGVIIGAGVDGLPLGRVHIVNEAGGVIKGGSDAGAGLAIRVEDPSAAYEEVLIVNKGTLEGDVILGAGKVEVQLL